MLQKMLEIGAMENEVSESCYRLSRCGASLIGFVLTLAGQVPVLMKSRLYPLPSTSI